MRPVMVVGSVMMVIFLAAIGCKDTGTTPPGTMLGVYEYVATDSVGARYESGVLLLSIVDSVTLGGSWNFDRSGKGDLTGNLTGNQFSLNLHPGWADHNLILNGTLESSRLTGQWSWVGIAGPMEGGLFVAQKR